MLIDVVIDVATTTLRASLGGSSQTAVRPWRGAQPQQGTARANRFAPLSLIGGDGAPDFFHAKEASGGRPLFPILASDRPIPLPWKRSRLSRQTGQP